MEKKTDFLRHFLHIKVFTMWPKRFELSEFQEIEIYLTEK